MTSDIATLLGHARHLAALLEDPHPGLGTWNDAVRRAIAAICDPNRSLTFREFSAINRARCEADNGFRHPIDGWSGSDWMTAVTGELGEAANIVKKLNRYRDGIPGNKEAEAALRGKLKHECGDTFIYLDLICQRYGFTIGEAAREAFNAKSAEIGYPVIIEAAE